MEKIDFQGKEIDTGKLLSMVANKVNETVDEINTCYSILLKVQDWVVKHEKEDLRVEGLIRDELKKIWKEIKQQQARGEDHPK